MMLPGKTHHMVESQHFKFSILFLKLVKVFINTHIFEPNILEKLFSILSRWYIAELRLTDPLPQLAVGGVLEVELGVPRSESYISESSHPHG